MLREWFSIGRNGSYGRALSKAQYKLVRWKNSQVLSSSQLPPRSTLTLKMVRLNPRITNSLKIAQQYQNRHRQQKTNNTNQCN